MLVSQSRSSTVAPVEPVYKDAGCKGLAIINEDVWNGSIKFIFLDWNALNGATYYQVYFLGSDGNQNVQVWDSRQDHPGDPSYTTKAFLDVTDELSGCGIIQGSEYQFKVIAYSGDDSKEYPVITVSIGKELSNIPTNLTANTVSKSLSWTGVTEATSYKAVICSDPNFTVWAWDTGTTRLPAPPPVPVNFNLGSGSYSWVVYAYYSNPNGRITEITYAISAFTIE